MAGILQSSSWRIPRLRACVWGRGRAPPAGARAFLRAPNPAAAVRLRRGGHASAGASRPARARPRAHGWCRGCCRARAMVSMLARIVAVASLGGFLFGYDLGLVSGALELIVADLGTSTAQEQLVVAGAKLGAFLGAFVGAALMLSHGRRTAIAHRRWSRRPRMSSLPRGE